MDGDLRERIASELGRALRTEIPATLLDVWTGRIVVPVETNFLIDGPDDILELNTTFDVPHWRPDLLIIGTDGGDYGIFVVRDDPDLEQQIRMHRDRKCRRRGVMAARSTCRPGGSQGLCVVG